MGDKPEPKMENYAAIGCRQVIGNCLEITTTATPAMAMQHGATQSSPEMPGIIVLNNAVGVTNIL